LLREAEEANLSPNLLTYCSAASACVRAGQWKTALDLIEEARASGMTVDEVACQITMRAWLSSTEKGRNEKVLSILMDMQKDPGLTPNIQCYSIGLQACARLGRFDWARSLLNAMHTQGPAPDLGCYNQALAACAPKQYHLQSAGAADAAGHLLVQMRLHGVEPDVVTYNTIIKAMAQAGNRATEVLDLIGQMQTRRVAKDVVTYTSAMAALARCNLGHRRPEANDEVGGNFDVDSGEPLDRDVQADGNSAANGHAVGTLGAMGGKLTYGGKGSNVPNGSNNVHDLFESTLALWDMAMEDGIRPDFRFTNAVSCTSLHVVTCHHVVALGSTDSHNSH
jgi:pentatricopeptide repeat protein